MKNINRLLHKKTLTAKDLGVIMIANLAAIYKASLQGIKEPAPIVSAEEFNAMAKETLTDSYSYKEYNNYVNLYNWILMNFNLTQTKVQQAQFCFRVLADDVLQISLAEDSYNYMAHLPEIMTEKQYNELKAQKIEDYLTDEKGEDLYSTTFNLIERAIHFYTEQLKTDPQKDNPLKRIRKKYTAEPLKSKIILSRWNEVHGNGYYSLPDGRRSDEMTADEWHAAIMTPELLEVMEASKEKATGWDARLEEIANQRLLKKERVIYEGGTEEDADEQTPALKVRPEWHTYKEEPDDLTKWDVIELEYLLDFYPAATDGGDPYSDKNYTKSMEDFYNEFKDLIDDIIDDMNKKYFKDEPITAALLYRQDYCISWRDLYKMDFYGEKAEAESDLQLFGKGKHGEPENMRALLNGVAILRPCDIASHCARINKAGNYEEPELHNALKEFTLEAYLDSTENSVVKVDLVNHVSEELKDSFYYVKGWNTAIDMIQERYGIPFLEAYRAEAQSELETRIEAYDSLLYIVYNEIRTTDYRDRELQLEKLKTFKEVFRPIHCKKIAVSEENQEKAKKLLRGFKAFNEKPQTFLNYFTKRPPEEEEENEEDYYRSHDPDDEPDENPDEEAPDETDEDGEGAGE